MAKAPERRGLEPLFFTMREYQPWRAFQSQEVSVTAEVASSSLVVPAILSKRVRRLSLKPSRTQKGTFSCPLLCPFSSRSNYPHPAVSFGSDGCDVPFASTENTNEKIA